MDYYRKLVSLDSGFRRNDLGGWSALMPAALLPSVTLRSGCKVNIYLDILGRRHDGYHDLLSLFLPLPEPCDLMTLKPATPGSGLHLTCLGRPIPGQTNILLRAYETFAAACGIAPDLEIVLTKHIPLGAGLGGGSSNAASLLRYLNSCLPRPMDDQHLLSLAATVGADAPFFLDNRPAWARGKGDVLSPASLSLTGMHAILVCPDVQVSTAWAYQAWDEARAGRDRPSHGLLTDQGRMDSIFTFSNMFFFNSFEHVVFPVHPHLRKIKEQLLMHGASGAAMSGSGSSIFALFRDKNGLERAVNWLEQTRLEFYVHWFNESAPKMSPLRGLKSEPSLIPFNREP